MISIKPFPVCTALAICLFAGVGCAAPSRSETNGLKIFGKPTSTSMVCLNTGTSLAGLDVENQRMIDSLISGLNESKMFASVSLTQTKTNTQNGINITADIKRLKKVSDEARVWSGALAGRASVTIHTTINDLKSGRLIAEFEVVGESGKSAFAGTTGEAISRATGQMVKEVLRLNALAEE